MRSLKKTISSVSVPNLNNHVYSSTVLRKIVQNNEPLNQLLNRSRCDSISSVWPLCLKQIVIQLFVEPWIYAENGNGADKKKPQTKSNCFDNAYKQHTYTYPGVRRHFACSSAYRQHCGQKRTRKNNSTPHNSKKAPRSMRLISITACILRRTGDKGSFPKYAKLWLIKLCRLTVR